MASSNIVPLGRGFSDTLRLRMAAVELSRARSRPASGLSGALSPLSPGLGYGATIVCPS